MVYQSGIIYICINYHHNQQVIAVIILSGFGGGLLIVGISLYSADDIFQTSSIIMIVFGGEDLQKCCWVCYKLFDMSVMIFEIFYY